ncbi:MAG: GYF domain-containing protein, partial [Persicimonas sp.]
MKFYCDNCNTKYAIADEKVRGKVLKVRCKKCESVITVREQTSPAQARSDHKGPSQRRPTNQRSSQAGPPAAPGRPQAPFDPRVVPWHYSLNGQSFGPFEFSALAERFASGELGDECYVWTDSFSNWKPVSQVDAFSDALAKSRRVKPRQNTIGVSQALEAVRPEEFERRQQKKQRAQKQKEQAENRDSSASARSESPAQLSEEASEASPAQTSPRKPDAEPSPKEAQKEEAQKEEAKQKQEDAQKDRLAKLRQRLKSEAGPGERPAVTAQPAQGDPSVDEELAADGGSPQPDADVSDGPTASPDDDELREDDALRTTLAASDAEQTSEGEADDDVGEHSGLFQDVDADAGPVGAQQDEASSSGPEESDQIPFLAGAPELSSESAKVADSKGDSDDGITGSLLIQLDNIQKQGRGKKTLLVAVALLVVGGLVGTGIYISSQYQADKPEPQAKASSADDDDDEVVIRTYGKDEQDKILALGDQRVDQKEAEADEEEEPAEEEEEDKKVEPRRMAQNSASSKSNDPVRGAERGKEEDSELDDAFKKARKKKAGKDNFRSGIDDGGVAKSNFDSPIAKDSSALNAAAAINSDRKDSIYKPTDSLNEREKASGGTKLTRKQINIGIKSVRRSVSLCRERHSRRGQPLEARKIYVTLTVEPTGSVSGFGLAPERVRHSEFERCMKS